MALYIWIAVGSALGGIARFALNEFVADRVGRGFPWGTLLINVLGSFAIGLFYTLTAPAGRWVVGEQGRIFFTVGICGGFTTFSAFSLQTLELLQTGNAIPAMLYMVGSVVLCVLFVWIGWSLGRL